MIKERQATTVPELREAGQLSAGSKCPCCAKTVKSGDVIFAFRVDISNLSPVVAIHKMCLMVQVDQQQHLQDEYDRIKLQVAEKGTLFDV